MPRPAPEFRAEERSRVSPNAASCLEASLGWGRLSCTLHLHPQRCDGQTGNSGSLCQMLLCWFLLSWEAYAGDK